MAAIDRLFRMIIDCGASDLYVITGSAPVLRLHGDVMQIEGEAVLSADQAMNLFREIMPPLNTKQFEEINDTDFAYELSGLGRFRANIFRDRKGPGAIFRLIPSKILTAEDLALPSAIIELCNLPKGLVLVTGPTGSGKSTTLCAMIDYINRTRNEHIITIEDPIEFVHENKRCILNQREVHSHTSSFKHALRAALREDPDVVLVGEMRDLETMEIAIETAETGHLVMGTLHTSTAASTVERIIDQFPAGKQNQVRQMLAGSLKGVISQTLLKRKDGRGRVAALEVLIVNAAIASNIREGKTHQIPSAMQTGGKQGMMLMNDSLIRLVMTNVVSAEEAFSCSLDKEDLMKRLAQEGIPLAVSKDKLATFVANPATNTMRAGTIAAKVPPRIVSNKPAVATDDFQTFREKLFERKPNN